MKHLLLFLLISFISADRLITKSQWVHDLIVLARDRQSDYNNKWPYNVLYYDGKKWFADCVNVNKALFNGRDIYDFTVGGYQKNLKNTGDITVERMIELCTDRSTNFNKLKSGEPRILHMSGHIGAYLGQVVEYGGASYNVVEATASFGHKIALSWIDSDGTRRAKKGGSTNGKWYQHGIPSLWVKY